MKMNLAIFKKGKPIYWIIGAVVLFVIFYLITSKGASSSGGGAVTYSAVNQGPSDAQVMASAQLSAAQIQANSQATAAAMEFAAAQEGYKANVALANIGASVDLAGIAAEREFGLASLDMQKQLTFLNSEYALETAKVVSNEAITMRQIDRAAFNDQLAANNRSLQIQSQSLFQQAAIAQIGSLKKKNRDDVLLALSSNFNNAGNAQIYLPAPQPSTAIMV